jgi:hypothetical protein
MLDIFLKLVNFLFLGCVWLEATAKQLPYFADFDLICWVSESNTLWHTAKSLARH